MVCCLLLVGFFLTTADVKPTAKSALNVQRKVVHIFSFTKMCMYSGGFFRSCSMDCQCDTCATLSSEWWLLVTRKVPSVLKQEIFSTTSGVVTDVVLVGRTCRCGDTSVDLQSEWRW